jgi:hypothetical protein
VRDIGTYLELGVHGDHLSGPAYAESEGFFFCLPYYVRLERGGEATTPPPRD